MISITKQIITHVTIFFNETAVTEPFRIVNSKLSIANLTLHASMNRTEFNNTKNLI